MSYSLWIQNSVKLTVSSGMNHKNTKYTMQDQLSCQIIKWHATLL